LKKDIIKIENDKINFKKGEKMDKNLKKEDVLKTSSF